MKDEDLVSTLIIFCDRLEALADQNEEVAMNISAIRGALTQTSPAFQAAYDRLMSDFKALAAKKTADAELVALRQLVSELSHPRS